MEFIEDEKHRKIERANKAESLNALKARLAEN